MDRQELKLLYKFGIATVISDTANALLSYLDKLIIPLFVGPSNLTYYNMPGSIASKIPSVSGSMAGVIFPMASQLEGEQKTDQIKTLYLKSTRLITLVSAAISITTISFAYQIMRFWLNIDFAEKTTNILILLVITNFILSLYSPIVNFLFGLNKLKVLIYSNFFMAIVNIILLIILLPKYGILGAAIAYLISVIPIVFIIIYTEQKILHLQNRSNYYIKTILGILVTGLVVFLINKIILSQITVNLLMLLIVSGISFLFYIFLYKILGFLNKEDSNDISAFTKTVFNSLKR